MNESNQITFMQARIARLFSQRWDIPFAKVAEIMDKYQAFRFIRECFDTFHVEGDDAVYEDVEEYLKHKGARRNE